MNHVLNLGQLCSDIVDCAHKTAPIDLTGSHFAVGTPAMRGNVINFAEARPISMETFEAWTTRLRPRHGDLLLAREAPVGPVVRIPESENVAPGQRTVLLRPKADVCDPRFLYYYLTSPTTQAELQVKAAGSTVPHLNVADVRLLPVPNVPELATQRAIAQVLGTLDDKIAANGATVRLLLDLANAHFTYAVREVGFGSASFGELAEVGGGGTPRTGVDEYWGGNIAWATPTDVTALSAPYLTATSRTITDEGLRACASALYPAGSILMTSRATIGAFAVAAVPTAVNQGFIVVNARVPAHQWWLFHEMQSRVPEFLSFANGATFLELPRGRFKELKVRVPEAETMTRFGELVEPIHAAASTFVEESRVLAATRDGLLPLLMSGKLRVRDVEKSLEEML